MNQKQQIKIYVLKTTLIQTLQIGTGVLEQL
jgi:hypothetical protein